MPSPVPALLNALVAIASSTVPRVAVTSGPAEVIYAVSLPDTSARTAVYIGSMGTAARAQGIDDSVLEDTSESADMGGRRHLAEVVVHCAAEALNGDSSLPAAVTDAYALRDAVIDAVMAGPLTGVQGRARAMTGALRTSQGTNGALASAQFDVTIQAFTT